MINRVKRDVRSQLKAFGHTSDSRIMRMLRPWKRHRRTHDFGAHRRRPMFRPTHNHTMDKMTLQFPEAAYYLQQIETVIPHIAPSAQCATEHWPYYPFDAQKPADQRSNRPSPCPWYETWRSAALRAADSKSTKSLVESKRRKQKQEHGRWPCSCFWLHSIKMQLGNNYIIATGVSFSIIFIIRGLFCKCANWSFLKDFKSNPHWFSV